MKPRAFVLIALLSVSVTLFAQEKEATEKFKYSNITEFGFTTVNPKGFSFEGTTVQGFAINKQHHLGLGIGFGANVYSYTYHDPNYVYSSTELYGRLYMPVYVNYRYCFNPNKTFSPHVNASIGGLWIQEGRGIYSAVTMGFRAGHFSFSSGVSFMAVREDYGYFYNPYPYTYSKYGAWRYPFGITLKIGFAF